MSIGVRAGVYGVRASVYGVGASVYGIHSFSLVLGDFYSTGGLLGQGLGLGLFQRSNTRPGSIHFIKHDDIFCNILMKDSHSNITLKAHLF